MKPVAIAVLVVAVASSSVAPLRADEAPDSLLKLREVCCELLKVTKAGDKEKASAIAKSFVLPDHERWFKKKFGDEKGALLAKDYAKTATDLETKMAKVFAALVAKGHMNFAGARFDAPDASGETGRETLAISAMTEKAPLLVAYFAGKEAKASRLGAFVFVDGSFRYAGRLAAVTEKAKAPDEDEVSPE